MRTVIIKYKGFFQEKYVITEITKKSITDKLYVLITKITR